MKLHSLFGAQKLKPAWTFSASHVLWRFLVSESGLIIGEDRDTDAKHVTFFCIEMHTGDVLWRGRTYGEAWWTGIEALTGERLYLHGFSKPDMPDHHGVTAIDARTGGVIWSSKEISFYAADDDRVIGYRDLFERRVFEEFNAADGSFLGERPQAGADAQEMRSRSFGRTDFLFPEPLPDDEPARSMIERIVGKESDPSAIIECARAPGRICFSAHLHTAHPGSLVHLLSVVDDAAGRELYRDTLNAETPYPMPDSFFIDRDRLFYIKEKQTLVSLPLT